MDGKKLLNFVMIILKVYYDYYDYIINIIITIFNIISLSFFARLTRGRKPYRTLVLLC